VSAAPAKNSTNSCYTGDLLCISFVYDILVAPAKNSTNSCYTGDLLCISFVYDILVESLLISLQVSNEDLWPEVQEQLKIPKSCTNADYGLRQLYIR
jgi:hypothetical protein